MKNIVCNNLENTDTLFEFSSVFLKINALKLLRKKLEINQLALLGGRANILDGEENKNYMIWSSNDTTSNQSIFVHTIEIEEVSLTYNNAKDIKSTVFLKAFKAIKIKDKILFSLDSENRLTVLQGKSIKATQVIADGEIKLEENNIQNIKTNTTLNNIPIQAELELKEKGLALKVTTRDVQVADV